MGKKQKKSNKGRKPKTERKPKAEKSEVNGEAKQSAKAFIEELCNAGNTTKAEAIALVVEKYQVTEKAAKGAVNNCRHYQKKEGRPVGDWKKAEKPAKDNTAAA